MRKICTFTVIVAFIFGFFIQPVGAEAIDFKDVNQNNAYYPGINYLANKDIINGYEDGTFKPYQTITRSQAAVLFKKAKNLSVPKNTENILNNFKDIDSEHNYAEAIAATYKAGIFKGSNGYFRDGTLTREQMATVLVQAYDIKDTDKSVEADLSNISPSHKNNVRILFQHNITNQKDNFRPREPVNRGQFATFLYKVIQNTDSDNINENEDVSIVNNEKELASALSSDSSDKVVKLGSAIKLTDTINVENEGVQIKGSSGDENHLITGAAGKTMFKVGASNVHFDGVRVLQKDGIAFHILSKEGFKLTKGMIRSADGAHSGSGIIVEDNYAPDVDKTAEIIDNNIEVPDIAVAFDGGHLILEDNLIEGASTAIKFTSIEVPKSVKGNIFLNNDEDIQTARPESFDKFIPLNSFDNDEPKINCENDKNDDGSSNGSNTDDKEASNDDIIDEGDDSEEKANDEESKKYPIKQNANLAEVEKFLDNKYGRIETPMGNLDLTYSIFHQNGSHSIPEVYKVDTKYGSYTQSFLYTIDKYQSDLNEDIYRIDVDEEKVDKTVSMLRNHQRKIYSIMKYVYPDKNLEGSFYDSYYKYPAIEEGYTSERNYSWKNYRNFGLDVYDVDFFFEEDWTVGDELEWEEGLE